MNAEHRLMDIYDEYDFPSNPPMEEEQSEVVELFRKYPWLYDSEKSNNPSISWLVLRGASLPTVQAVYNMHMPDHVTLGVEGCRCGYDARQHALEALPFLPNLDRMCKPQIMQMAICFEHIGGYPRSILTFAWHFTTISNYCSKILVVSNVKNVVAQHFTHTLRNF